MSDFELLYASDGVYPKRGQMIIVDEQREYPPGHYRMRNVKIDDVQFFDFDSKFGKPVTVVPGDYDETPRIEVVKVAPPEKLREDIVSLEEFQPQDNMLPYEHMFRTFAQIYGLKTKEELQHDYDDERDDVMDEMDPKMVESTFGLEVREEYHPDRS